jgi:hypothetical protein
MDRLETRAFTLDRTACRTKGHAIGWKSALSSGQPGEKNVAIGLITGEAVADFVLWRRIDFIGARDER